MGTRLTPSQLDPAGYDGAADAPFEDLDLFVSLIEEEASEDRFLDKHFREREHMASAAKQLNETRELRTQVERVLSLLGAASKSADGASPWEAMEIRGSAMPAGWKPKQGELYSAKLPHGATGRFMISGTIMSVEYEFPDGAKWYADVDPNGNTSNMTLAYPTEEYSIVIPPSRILRETVTDLIRGYKRYDVVLRWGGSVTYVVDGGGKLDGFSVTGGVHIDHQQRTIRIPERSEQPLT